MCQAQG
ncbi:rCG33978 [Rattus norvegicus]|nr:rCG33978 [Rattus norvegicus]